MPLHDWSEQSVWDGVRQVWGVELLYALKIKMAYGAVQNRAGKFIHADLPSVTAAAKGALKDIPEDLRFSLTDAPGEEAYPIAGTVSSWNSTLIIYQASLGLIFGGYRPAPRLAPTGY